MKYLNKMSTKWTLEFTFHVDHEKLYDVILPLYLNCWYFCRDNKWQQNGLIYY